MQVFVIAGYSGSGKTTLLEAVIPCLRERGLRISVIKHSHHGFDIDKPGKDSWRHREAGAQEVMLLSNQRWVLMHELRDQPEPSLEEQLSRLSPCDLVLIEGFKTSPLPKIEVYRPANGKPPLWVDNSSVVAVASDEALPELDRPWLDLNQPAQVAEFIVNYLKITPSPQS